MPTFAQRRLWQQASPKQPSAAGENPQPPQQLICHRQWHRRQICHRYQRHQWQIMGTISDCWHLKVNLEEKMYLYVNSTTQRCPNKRIKKLFWLKIFYICHWCQRHRWCALSCKYFLKFSKGHWGNWFIILKKLSRQSRGTVLLINIFFVRSKSTFTRSY